jgi:hypothetical protein
VRVDLEDLGFSRCELLLWEAGSWGQEHCENPDERERPPLEAATEQRLVKTWLHTNVCNGEL